MRAVVTACAGDNGDSARYLFCGVCDSADVVFIVKCGRFARCAADNERVYASFYLVFDKSTEFFIVYAVFVKGSDEGRGNAFEYCFLFHIFYLPFKSMLILKYYFR